MPISGADNEWCCIFHPTLLCAEYLAMNQTDSKISETDPGVASVYQYLMYGLSLPERAIRTTAATIGGAVHESATLLVPQAFRDSKTYNVFVHQMIEMLANDVGGVERPGQMAGSAANSEATSGDENDDEQVDGMTQEFVARKTVGTFIDLAGLATLHVSPLTVLAIVSDVAYGTKTYLHELSEELKREGVIDEHSTINSAGELLEAIAKTSSDTADQFDQPPLSVQGLADTIQQTTDQLSTIDPTLILPQAEITRLWSDMQTMADRENVNLFEISSAMTMYTLDNVNTVTKGALTTVRVTGQLIDREVFEHYRKGLSEIQEQGLYSMLAETSEPYIKAVWFNFSSDRPTLTEDVVSGKMATRVWSEFQQWRTKPTPERSEEE